MVFPVLEGRVAVVTGAAMGMGEATARLFAQAGAKVVIADINEEAGRATTDALRADGLEVAFVRADVSSASSVEAMVAFAVQTYGRLDCAVNNAAMTPDTHPVAELDESEFDRLIAVDLKGVALCLTYEIRQMLAQGGGGAIVNISSVSGVRPQPNNLAYVAAKHAVIGMTKVASLEYAPSGIRVNSVGPGAIDTPMLRGALETIGATEEEFAPQLSLLGRFGQPSEVAEASMWLCSDQSSYVTGALLMVDAGYTSR
ncbi:glucose 1-dehydrogenase [Georgenia sp. EYE_87]|uniref:SDR family NAD(P)-dependent oxidoreductase n=1 Tax=Georgenia sp. EYE_87 TaxID=2853448 RepID=UPI0020037F3B|nr:glucose 1-dehydrogenase [Georgenia sp. EYE_87]MCK6212192.1 glucose 1-dehydrogenase [Georgenia sp. EYE_87]